MSNEQLVPILEVGITYKEMNVISKSKSDRRCTFTGEGPCGEYYLITLQSVIDKRNIEDIYQCSCCGKIIGQVGAV